jgi:hypothetical protein
MTLLRTVILLCPFDLSMILSENGTHFSGSCSGSVAYCSGSRGSANRFQPANHRCAGEVDHSVNASRLHKKPRTMPGL